MSARRRSVPSLCCNKVLLGCLVGILAVCLTAPAMAEPLEISPSWAVGDQWRLLSRYRQPDGRWSAQLLEITVDVKADEPTQCQVDMTVDTLGNSITMIFQKPDYQLSRVVSREKLRDEILQHVIDFQGSAPTYHTAGAIPVYMPLFHGDDAIGPYHLKRNQNGIPMIGMKLSQEIIAANHQSAANWLPEKVAKAIPGAADIKNARWVVVSKSGKTIFKQLWHSDYAWPLYTEADNSMTWMVSHE